MKHFDEHTLELFVLKAGEVDSQRAAISRHLRKCAGCREVEQYLSKTYASIYDALSHDSTEVLSTGREIAPIISHITKLKQIGADEIEANDHLYGAIGKLRKSFGQRPGASILAGLVTVGMLAIAVSYFSGSVFRNTNPAYVHLDPGQGMMQVYNRENRLLWQIPGRINSDLVRVINAGGHPFWQVCDLNNNGKNEVVSVIPGLGGHGGIGNSLNIYSSKGKLESSTNIDIGPVVYNGHDYVSHFGPSAVLVSNPNAAGLRNILVNLTNGYSPACILRLNAYGKPIGEFWHYGNFFGMALVKLENGTKTYLVAYGENDLNDVSSIAYPVIVVLDPEKIVGKTESNVTPGFGVRPSMAEVYYIRLPNSDANHFLNVPLRVTEMNGESSNRISFVVDSPASQDEPSFTYTFSKDFKVQNISASTGTVLQYKQLKESGKVNHLLDPAYLQQLKSSVEYWNGSAWVKTVEKVDVSVRRRPGRS